MAWFSALASLGFVAAATLVTATLWRRKRQRVAAPEAPPAAGGEPGENERVYSLAEAQELADEAERAGDCERAAELLESVGMYQRAIVLYRRGGNIQQAAELELAMVDLGRMAGDMSFASQSEETGPMAHHSDAPLAVGDSAYAGADEDVARMHDAAVLAHEFQANLEVETSAVRPASLRPASLRPAVVSERPRPKSSAPPPRRSERPRGPSVQDLTGMLGPSPTPDLGNIEIYYRLGLAHLAANQQEEARQAFMTVEDISPGYRDTDAYLEQLQPSAAQLPGRASNANDAHEQRGTPSGVRGRGIVEEVRAVSGRERRDDR